jgi:hypothetical protein
MEFITISSNPRNARRQHSVDLESENMEEGSKKRHRACVNEELFPWKGTSAVLRARLGPEVQQWLDLLDNWATDSTLIVRKLLLSPG